MGEEQGGKGAGPVQAESVRLIKVAIVVVVVISAVAIALPIALPFVLQAIAQPNIILTNVETNPGFCAGSFSFTLINTGDAGGFAKVQFLIGGIPLENRTYFVPARTTLDTGNSVDVAGCDLESTRSMRLDSTWKA